jgi:hypothetical protein
VCEGEGVERENLHRPAKSGSVFQGGGGGGGGGMWVSAWLEARG